MAAAAVPGGAEQAVVTSPGRVTDSPTAPVHPCIEGCRRTVQLLHPSWPPRGWGSPAVSSCLPRRFNEGRERGGGCWIRLVSRDFALLPAKNRPLGTLPGAVIAWGPIEPPKAALLLQAEFLFWLLLLWIFPCEIPPALYQPSLGRVGMPWRLPAPGFGTSSAPALHGSSSSSPTSPRLWKRFWRSLLLIHTHESCFSEWSFPWSCMN